MIGTPNLTLKEEEQKSLEAVYQGNSVFIWPWVPTEFGKSICCQASCSSIRKGNVVAHSAIASHATCFMSNQICHVEGDLWFLFDSYTLLLYRRGNGVWNCIHYLADTRL